MTITENGLRIASPQAIADLHAGLPDFEQALAFYHQHLAPDTAVDLSVAENVLLYHDSMQRDVFEKIRLIPELNIKYMAPVGIPWLRQQAADLLTRAFGRTVVMEDVFGCAGVSSALECIAYGLMRRQGTGGVPLKPGDEVLIPAPYWQGFNWSFQERPKLKCVPVHLPTHGEDRYRLTLNLVVNAYEARKEAGHNPRLLVLTNPHNPLGVNYPKELLDEIYGWALAHTDLHIISDEIYCHSQLDTGTTPFTSAVALDAYQEHADRVHVVWGFAKDFGLSGFRTGFVISKNEAVHRAMLGSDDPAEQTRALPWFTPFDSLKTYVIGELFKATVDGEPYPVYAMREYRTLLSASFRRTKDALDAAGIEYVHQDGDNAAMFFWLDLTRYLGKRAPGEHVNGLPAIGPDGLDPNEEWLFRYLAAKPTEVSLLPGGTMHNAEPGFFRLCFTSRMPDDVEAAVRRVGVALQQLK
ncbi:pyridoxal phosphate-dependent aminotransferase [Kitasatospora sp. NPDC001261]|uniref:pyridoxal phosphate-dependent aminotransferase n=1 Tax=Kitasatospora sp. NPDC001261 TaxID=3364012 RepID=UPI00367AD5DC